MCKALMGPKCPLYPDQSTALIAWRLLFSELDGLSIILTAGGGACRLQSSRHASLTARPARKLCRQAIKAVLRFVSNVLNLHKSMTASPARKICQPSDQGRPLLRKNYAPRRIRGGSSSRVGRPEERRTRKGTRQHAMQEKTATQQPYDGLRAVEGAGEKPR